MTGNTSWDRTQDAENGGYIPHPECDLSGITLPDRSADTSFRSSEGHVDDAENMVIAV